ncbi:hypothetical protein D3C73_1378720 [compost metagenome]
MLIFVFASVLLYFFSTTLVFHKYRHIDERLGARHLAFMLGLFSLLFIINLFVQVPNYFIIGEMMLFFAVYAKVTT